MSDIGLLLKSRHSDYMEAYGADEAATKYLDGTGWDVVPLTAVGTAAHDFDETFKGLRAAIDRKYTIIPGNIKSEFLDIRFSIGEALLRNADSPRKLESGVVVLKPTDNAIWWGGMKRFAKLADDVQADTSNILTRTIGEGAKITAESLKELVTGVVGGLSEGSETLIGAAAIGGGVLLL